MPYELIPKGFKQVSESFNDQLKNFDEIINSTAFKNKYLINPFPLIKKNIVKAETYIDNCLYETDACNRLCRTWVKKTSDFNDANSGVTLEDYISEHNDELVKKTFNRKYYLFQEPTKDSIVWPVLNNHLVFVLDKDNYGFPDNRIVNVKQDDLTVIKRRYSDNTELPVFKNINGEVSLNCLLDTVCQAAKDSMIYNPVLAREWYKGKPDLVQQNIEQFYAECEGLSLKGDLKEQVDQYKLLNKKIIGICRDNGDLIRSIIKSFNLDGFFVGHARAIEPGHDTTLVIDLKSQHWVLLNSLSLVKKFNIIQKSDFEKFDYLLVGSGAVKYSPEELL